MIDQAGVYEQRLKIKASDCDMFRRLRMSVLFRYLQEISIAHTEALGFPRETTLDKGALWVIARISIRMSRPVCYDEELILRSWPGEMMHVIFPRYYSFAVSHGDGSEPEEIGKGAAVWTLINAETRRFVLPQTLGIVIPGHTEGHEMQLPAEIPPLGEEAPGFGKAERRAGISEVDLNGHVNNTKYLDWMDDLMDDAFYRTHFADEIQVNFYREIHAGEDVKLKYLLTDRKFLMEGATEGERNFALSCSVRSMPEDI